MVVLCGFTAPEAGAAKSDTTLESRADSTAAVPDANGNGNSGPVAISADGRYVAFASTATNLHPDDSDTAAAIYVRDRQTGTTELVSRPDGVAAVTQANAGSSAPSISADGRFVAFSSTATNLHPDDGESVSDVFVRDRMTNATILVSRDDTAGGANSDGLGELSPVISADGTAVAWISQSTNLDPLDDSNSRQIYVRDLPSHANTLVSLNSAENDASAGVLHGPPAVSADGSVVAWSSPGTDLHFDDADSNFDVFVRDLDAGVDGVTTLESRNSSGVKANSGGAVDPALSGDGRHVAFSSNATNLDPIDVSPSGTADIFVRDRVTGTTSLVTVPLPGESSDANDDSNFPAVSDDGRFVSFDSESDVLAADDPDTCIDAFVRDTQAGVTTLVSRSSGASGAKSNGCGLFVGSGDVAMSPEGRFVAFRSDATNLHPDDPTTTQDVYLRDVLGPPPPAGGGGDNAAPNAAITKGPNKKSKKRKATFEFSADEAGATFECSLDGAPFASCSSPLRVKVRKKPKKHTFRVRARDAAGNVDATPAQWSWKVRRKKPART